MKRIIIAGLLSLLFLLPKHTVIAETPVTKLLQFDPRTEQLENFFKKYKCPQPYYLEEYINAADKYKIDYRLLPAIYLHESTCGKKYPRKTNNPFGWLERKGTVAGFKSVPDAIDFITGRLANHSPYAGKSIVSKLHTYCPSPAYPTQTMGYMKQISPELIK